MKMGRKSTLEVYRRMMADAEAFARGDPRPTIADVGTMDDDRHRAVMDERAEIALEVKAAVMARDWKLARKLAQPLLHPLPRPSKDQRPYCDATTRKGEPCRALAVWVKGEPAPRNGKCRIHGGLSTGPRTPEGKAAIAESNRRRARKTA